ncbi:MAG: exodeoxyribonuclease VII large subunit, partial [Bacteroidota bacterium]|nr:exodeoxyribonuclease VII large subunit [Bacteroidota bacterium]
QAALVTGLRKDTRLQLLNNSQQIRQTGLIFRKDVISFLNRTQTGIDLNIFQIRRGFKQASAAFAQYVDLSQVRLISSIVNYIRNNRKELEGIEKNIGLMDPKNVLKRGYSITIVNGNVLQKVEDANEGDILETILSDGDIVSVVKKINKTEKS